MCNLTMTIALLNMGLKPASFWEKCYSKR